jgi:hypothetical protein
MLPIFFPGRQLSSRVTVFQGDRLGGRQISQGSLHDGGRPSERGNGTAAPFRLAFLLEAGLPAGSLAGRFIFSPAAGLQDILALRGSCQPSSILPYVDVSRKSACDLTLCRDREPDDDLVPLSSHCCPSTDICEHQPSRVPRLLAIETEFGQRYGERMQPLVHEEQQWCVCTKPQCSTYLLSEGSVVSIPVSTVYHVALLDAVFGDAASTSKQEPEYNSSSTCFNTRYQTPRLWWRGV